ncbi:MAG: sugar ABC transporter substrate-binding protein [Eubacteriales bacterium]
MKKILLFVMVILFAFTLIGCNKEEPVKENDPAAQGDVATDEAVVQEPAEEMSIGFVMIGLGNEFFEGLKAEFEARFTDLGWDVDVANGEFNPQTQITAVENFIAMEKDVILIWAVSAEPLGSVVEQAMDAGIKVIGFVEPLTQYDACLKADNVGLAIAEAKLAAKWIEDTFPDAEDGSVPCAVITRDNVESTKEQGDILRNFADFCPKAKVVTVYENNDETVEGGVMAAETLYTSNPEVKVFLTVNSATALGMNNYFTAMSSPVTDYSEMGIFTANGGMEIFDPIILSATDESPMRGTIVTGGIEVTVDDMVIVAYGVLDGTYEQGYDRFAANIFVYDDTVLEYIETGNVLSVTEEDFE